MVSLVVFVDYNRVVEMRASPTAMADKGKVTTSKLILRQRTTDSKPTFLLVTKNYNSAGYEACYIKLYTKQGMCFGDCTAGYLVNYL